MTASGPPYPGQLQLPAAGQTFTPLIELATREELDDYDHSAALASLATAGMCMLAFQHETHRDLRVMAHTAKQLRGGDVSVEQAADLIESLHARMKQSNQLLAGPLNVNARNDGLEARRYSVQRIAESAWQDVSFFVGRRGFNIEYDIEPGLLLPPASYSEWSVMFSNAFVNAANAISRRLFDEMDGEENPPRIVVEARNNEGAPPTILIHDNGDGVDLAKAHELFRPFRRGVAMRGRRSDNMGGFGGFGLGTSIIQLVAGRHRMRATFVKPPEPFATTLSIAPEPAPDLPTGVAGQTNYMDEHEQALRSFGRDARVLSDIKPVVEIAITMAQAKNDKELTACWRDLGRTTNRLKGPAAEQARVAGRERLDRWTEYREQEAARRASS